MAQAYGQKGLLLVPELREHPALVHCGTSEDVPEASMGFATRAVTAPWHLRVARALALSGSRANPILTAKAGAVYAVAKRPGRPFPDRIGVGRVRTADISLRLDSLSKYHAYFTCDGETWQLWDARSRNGTMVGDKEVAPGQGMTVTDSAQIMFGDEAFLFFMPAGFRALLKSLG